MVVDLGGVYFQLLMGTLYAVALAATGWAPLRTALVLVAGSCLFSLNPILKQDGYWIVADSLVGLRTMRAGQCDLGDPP